MSGVKSALLVGVGGQGAILISKIMANGFMQAGFDVKQSEVHGMAQRGGSVSTQVRWGDKVYGPVFGKGEADILVALEKMEAVRYAEFDQRRKRQEALAADEVDEADLKVLEQKLSHRPKNG